MQRAELWTCGMKRKLDQRSQIDYIGVSSNLAGATALNFLDLKGETPLSIKMECGRPMMFHRIIKGIYKAAWKELRFTLDDGSAPLRQI